MIKFLDKGITYHTFFIEYRNQFYETVYMEYFVAR